MFSFKNSFYNYKGFSQPKMLRRLCFKFRKSVICDMCYSLVKINYFVTEIIMSNCYVYILNKI